MDPITLRLFKTFGPYLLVAATAAFVGFSGAWYIQGLRLTAAKNDTTEVQNAFLAYHNEQERLALEKEQEQLRRQASTDKDWKEKLNDLKNDHDVYRRCVAGGRCGGLRPVPAQAAGDGVRLSPAGRSDEAGTDAISAAGGAAPVVLDCAETTLQLNVLQADVEAQRGYRR